jgi:hypothetical protein
VLLLAAGVFGQSPADPAAPSPGTPGENLRVYLLTLSPGDAIWERFGHNALVIVDPDARPQVRSLAFNWGTFSFDQPNFVGRFIMGRMLYSLDVWPTDEMVAAYTREGRTILQQELQLTARQKLRLRDYCFANAQPQNRDYRYDYYLDNCSTRVRDAIDHALEGAVARQLQDNPTGTTFRWHTRRLMRNVWHWNVALNYVMGHPIDRPIDRWEECFLPGQLAQHLQRVKVTLDDHSTQPLVGQETILNADRVRPPVPTTPADLRPLHAGIGIAVAGVLLLAGYLGRSSRAWRAAFTVIAAAFALLVGTGACIGLWGWLFTDHTVARWNENLLAVSPPTLALAVLIPVAAWARRLRRATLAVATVTASLALLAVLVKLLPGFTQVNGEILWLMVPIQFAIFGGCWLLLRVFPRRLPERVRTQRSV